MKINLKDGREPICVKTRSQSFMKREVTMNLADLCRIGQEGLEKALGERIPNIDDLQIHIPGGGDYSNMDLAANELECTVSWSWEEGGQDD